MDRASIMRVLRVVREETVANVRGVKTVTREVYEALGDPPGEGRLRGFVLLAALRFSDRACLRPQPPGGSPTAPLIVTGLDESMLRVRYREVRRAPRVFRVEEVGERRLREKIRAYGAGEALEVRLA